jgi:PleD family two-component response regulator
MHCCAVVSLVRIPCEQESVSLSVSIGGAIFQKGARVEELMARADKMLYASKENGRARATVAFGS